MLKINICNKMKLFAAGCVTFGAMGLRKINAWQRGVVLTFGKYNRVIHPGLNIIVPFAQSVKRVDVNDKVLLLPKQSLISRDKVTFFVDSSVRYQVTDPKKYVINVAADEFFDNNNPIEEMSQMALIKTLSSMTVNEILHELKKASENTTSDLKYIEEEWGVKIKDVQIKNISFDETMTRAMAVEAEKNAKGERNPKDRQITADYVAGDSKILNEAAIARFY